MTALDRRAAEIEAERTERRRWMKEHMPAAYASYVELWKVFDLGDENAALSGFMAEENGHAITIGGNPRITGDDSTCGCCYLYQYQRYKKDRIDVRVVEAKPVPRGLHGLARQKFRDMGRLREGG